MFRYVTLLLAAALLTLTGGCESSVNPATGKREALMMTESQERKIGAEQHPKIVEAFGGAVTDSKLTGYVAQIAGRVVSNTETPRAQWTFTVLDSPVVNAFALPGGYIYITRGLMALANDEAELASVLGHEAGHVTGRHGAQRHTRSTIANIIGVAATIGAASAGIKGADRVGQIAQIGAAGYVASFSRSQELEADRFGVRYVSRAGYDPHSGADFLRSLSAQKQLHANISGNRHDPNRVDFFSTHPATPQRVRQAISEAEKAGERINRQSERRQSAYFKALDGMVYGDSAEQGFVRGRKFSHPKLRFSFTVPSGFRITNNANHVAAQNSAGASIAFTGSKDPGGSVDEYIEKWAAALSKSVKTTKLNGPQAFKANGLDASTGLFQVATKKGILDLRLVAYRFPDVIYRFQILYPPSQRKKLKDPLSKMASGMRRLSKREAAKLKPLRIRIHKVRRGQSAASIAAKMPFDSHKEARFRVLNGLTNNEKLRAGQLVKIVSSR